MSYWKSFGLATFAVVCLLGEATASETTGCYLQGCATEWSGGEIINLGALPGYSQSIAGGINNAGQAVGISYSNLAISATEWSGGKVINLGLGGANAINDVGQVVGESNGAMGGVSATEWSGGSVIDLGGLPGSLNSAAYGINDTGEAVGYSIVGGVQYAVEWSNGSIINLEGLPGFTSSSASGINSAGQVVGDSVVGGVAYATEWNGGTVINLGTGQCLWHQRPRTGGGLRPWRGHRMEQRQRRQPGKPARRTWQRWQRHQRRRASGGRHLLRSRRLQHRYRVERR